MGRTPLKSILEWVAVVDTESIFRSTSKATIVWLNPTNNSSLDSSSPRVIQDIVKLVLQTLDLSTNRNMLSVLAKLTSLEVRKNQSDVLSNEYLALCV